MSSQMFIERLEELDQRLNLLVTRCKYRVKNRAITPLALKKEADAIQEIAASLEFVSEDLKRDAEIEAMWQEHDQTKPQRPAIFKSERTW